MNCTYTEESKIKREKLLPTLLTVKLRVQKSSFLRRSHHQTNSMPPESRNCYFTHIMEPLSVSHHLCEEKRVLQSIPSALISAQLWIVP